MFEETDSALPAFIFYHKREGHIPYKPYYKELNYEYNTTSKNINELYQTLKDKSMNTVAIYGCTFTSSYFQILNIKMLLFWEFVSFYTFEIVGWPCAFFIPKLPAQNVNARGPYQHCKFKRVKRTPKKVISTPVVNVTPEWLIYHLITLPLHKLQILAGFPQQHNANYCGPKNILAELWTKSLCREVRKSLVVNAYLWA